MILTSRLISLLALTAYVPFSEGKALDVFVPPITNPKAGDVLHVGEKFNVTWDITNAPEQITNKKGELCFVKNDLIQCDPPLADGFDILKGWLEIKIPKAEFGIWRFVLFGDSGNWSPPFTIKE